MQDHREPSDPKQPLAFFNREAETLKSKGAFLPHWSQGGVIYFVTFRLADSLPQEKLRALNQERKNWLEAHPGILSEGEKAEFYDRFSKPQQRWLDAGYGSMILRRPEVRHVVESTLKYFDRERYHLNEFVVAANHVHALVSPLSGFDLGKILHSWKGYSARQIGIFILSLGIEIVSPLWQQESWDHIVRSEASLEKFRRYIRAHDAPPDAVQSG